MAKRDRRTGKEAMDLLHFLKSWNLWATLATLFHICFASDNSTSHPQQQQHPRPHPQKAHESPPSYSNSNSYLNKAYYPLIVSVYEVSRDSVEIDWSPNQGENWSLRACQLVYGPLDDPSRLEVLSNFLPESHSFRVTGLTVNVSYHCHLVCFSKEGARLQSNTLRFTTGSSAPSAPAHFVSSDSFRGFESPSFRSSSSSYSGSSVSSSSDEDGSGSLGSGGGGGRSSVQSSSVVLGAVCGIVGFLIINVTVVMAVRRYSQRQVRRRRILHLQEEREYDDFPYLRGFE